MSSSNSKPNRQRDTEEPSRNAAAPVGQSLSSTELALTPTETAGKQRPATPHSGIRQTASTVTNSAWLQQRLGARPQVSKKKNFYAWVVSYTGEVMWLKLAVVVIVALYLIPIIWLVKPNVVTPRPLFLSQTPWNDQQAVDFVGCKHKALADSVLKAWEDGKL